MSTKNPDNPLVAKSFAFALQTIQLADSLEKARRHVMSRQLYKSGTSIGANIREAQSAESLADFIHKMKIALKEAEETEYWLELCYKSTEYPDPIDLLSDLKEILKLLNATITTCKRKLK